MGEEDLLGFHVFVAELELLVGNARGDRGASAVALLELLQKLVVSIDHTPVSVLRQYQRRCEQVLLGLLQRGVFSEVRYYRSTRGQQGAAERAQCRVRRSNIRRSHFG